MPKRRAPAGCYWRGDTLWYRVIVRGQEIRGTLRTDDARIAAERRARIVEELTAKVHFGQQRMTWDTAAGRFVEEVAPQQIAAGTLKRYVVSLKQVYPWLRERYVDQIDRKLVGEIVSARRKAGASNATINRDLTAISAVLDYCVAIEMAETNAARDFPRRSLNRERRDPIVLPEPTHIKAVIAEVPGMLADMARVAWLTGCRINELATLTWRQIDLRERRLMLETTKRNKVRAVPISEAAHLVLSALPRRLDQPWVFWHADEKGSADRYRSADSLFCAKVRKQAADAEKAGKVFHRFRFHDLRHRFAVDYLRAGGSIYDLQQILGHTSIKTTEVYLAYLTPEEAAAVKRGTAQIMAQPAHAV